MSDNQLLHYQDLKNLGNMLASSGMKTAFFEPDETLPIPMLNLALDLDFKGEPLVMSLVFSPFSLEDVADTRFMQMSVDCNYSMNGDIPEGLYELCCYTSSLMVFGFCTVIDDEICFRASYPISNSQSITDPSVLEVIGMLTVSACSFSQILVKFAMGSYTLTEAKEKFLNLSKEDFQE